MPDSGKKSHMEDFSQSKELEGTLGYGDELMKSVIESDKDTVEKGNIIKDALDRGIGSFSPDIMMEKFVQNYKMAEKLYGETLIRRISGYDPRYIEKNIKTPEFQKELDEKISQNMKELRKQNLIDKNNTITEKGIELASLTLYVEELDNLVSRGYFGEKVHKQKHIHGSKDDINLYKRGDRYRDIDIRKSIQSALKRSHNSLSIEDVKVHERKSKGDIEIIYGIDASSSMKGEKLGVAKRAGVALSFRAIDEKDKVGLIVFGDDILSKVYPSRDFGHLLKEITMIKPRGQTDLSIVLKESIELFSSENKTKHLVILSDALPTAGDTPHKETLQAVSQATASGITVSLIGLNLDKEGKQLGEKLVEVGNGRFYIVSNIKELDRVVLLDYYSV